MLKSTATALNGLGAGGLCVLAVLRGALSIVVLALPFVLGFASLTREQTRSFHAGSLIVNVVVLMVGILAVLGSAHDAGLARTSAREVLIAAVFVFYVLTPALNVVLITRLLRATPPGPTPD